MTEKLTLVQAVADAAENAVRVVIMPIDVVQLVTGSLSGLAALISALAAAFAIVSSIRSGRAETIVKKVETDISNIKTNVTKLEVATNSLVAKAEAAARAAGHKEATEDGEAKAATLKKGQEEGRGQQSSRMESASLPKRRDELPLPVQDDAAAKIQEEIADSMKKSAIATEKIADAGEKKSRK